MKLDKNGSFTLFVLRMIVGVITTLLLLAAFLAPKRVTQLHPAPHTVLNVYDDREKEGGQSEAVWIDPTVFGYKCTIREGAQYRLCGLSMKFYKEPRAERIYDGNPDAFSLVEYYDLSHYDGLLFDFRYSGPAEKLRFFTRNSMARDDDIENILDHKLSFAYTYKEEFSRNKPIYLEFDEFTVADWWLEEFNISRRHAMPTFDKVLEVNIDLPADAALGEHHFVLTSVSAIGDWVPPELVYWTIIGLWLMVLCVEAGHRFYVVNTVARSYRTRLESLEAFNRNLQESANRDALTELYNRRGLETIAQLIWQDNDISNTAVLILDIDFFKNVNDTYGHLAGDEVLKEFTKLLKQNIRHSDKLARWGGEEFVMISPQSSMASAEGFAENLRLLIESHPFKITTDNDGYMTLKLTTSIGLAMVQPPQRFDEVLRQADDALYNAKKAGRNKVISHPYV